MPAELFGCDERLWKRRHCGKGGNTMKKRLLSLGIIFLMCLSLLPAGALAGNGEDGQATTMTLAEFVAAVEDANYNYDGNGVVVEIAPASGCRQNHAGHPAVVENQTPERLQNYSSTSLGTTYYAQYQRFSGEMNISIANVIFRMVTPADSIHVCGAWNTTQTTATPDKLDAELQLLNTGSVSFAGCTFENVAVSPIGASSVSFSGCNFSGLAAYAVKDVKAATVSVTGCKFDSCDGGVYMNGGGTTNAIYTNNAFEQMGSRGAIQFSATGDYGNAALSIAGNSFAPAQSGNGFLRLLNYTLPQTVLSQMQANNPEIVGSLYTSDSIDSTAQLPAGTSFPEGMTVHDGEAYYGTLKAALEGIHEKDIHTLWCKPNADVGEMTHGHVCADLTVYGNGAYISGGERDFELDTYETINAGNKGSDLSGDVTLRVYNLTGAAVWGERHSAYTLNIYLENCQNMNRVYLTETTGTNNITLKGCSFDGAQTTVHQKANTCTVYSNAPGTILVEDCAFGNVREPINLNNKSEAGTTQTVTVKDCTFTDCSTEAISSGAVTWAAPIRIVSTAGAVSKVNVEDCTFAYTDGSSVNGDILLGEGREGKQSYPVYALLSNTDAAVQIQHPGDRTADTNNGKTVAVTADQGMELSNAEARIGDTGYMLLADAIQQAAHGDTVTLLQKYEGSAQIEIVKAITIELGATGTSPDPFVAGDGYRKEISGTKLVFSSSSSSGGGSSSSGNKTETTQNPDGSTTTTVTRPDGSTTATTKYPDGSTEVVDTKKDGTVTTTTTDADGNKTQVVENTDGSSKTTIDRKDGSGSVTIVDENGNVVSQTTLSESAIKAAQTAGKPVELPIPAVTASADAASAPTVTVGLQGNTPIKVEIPVGNITPGTVAVLVMEDGTEEIIKTTIAMENGVVVTLADGATVKLVDNTKAFADVPDVYWGADEIAFAASRALMNGTGSSTFSPEAPMTRAMVVTVLARYEGVDTTTGETWYDAGRDWAMENGVSDGTDMDASVTREQLAAMLWRYAGEPAVSGAVTGFTDAGKISDWAADAMAWAVENGLLNGVDDGRLAPQSTATRAQVAAILTRFVALTA